MCWTVSEKKCVEKKKHQKTSTFILFGSVVWVVVYSIVGQISVKLMLIINEKRVRERTMWRIIDGDGETVV